jgi:hypothetical protein
VISAREIHALGTPSKIWKKSCSLSLRKSSDVDFPNKMLLAAIAASNASFP